MALHYCNADSLLFLHQTAENAGPAIFCKTSELNRVVKVMSSINSKMYGPTVLEIPGKLSLGAIRNLMEYNIFAVFKDLVYVLNLCNVENGFLFER